MSKAKVLYDYVPRLSSELNIKAEDIVEIITYDAGDGWSVAKNSAGVEGMIPTDYVELIKMSTSHSVTNTNNEEKDVDNDEWDSSDEDSTGKANSVVSGSDRRTIRDSITISDSTKSNTIIRMPKVFLKSGGEDFILGLCKPSLKIEAKVEIINDNSSEVCVWMALGEPQTSTIISNSVDSKFKGMKTFVTYQLESSYTKKPLNRRYKQFHWLHKQLVDKYMCIAIPPLPSPQVVGRYKNNFIAGRQKHLQKWLTHVCDHPVLAHSETIKLFLTSNEKNNWKTGKRKTESDPYKGGKFFCAIEAPVDEIEWKNYSKRIDKVYNFVDNFEKGARSLQEKYNDFHKRQSGSIPKEFKKIGTAIIELSKSMSLNPDNNKNDISLLHGLQKTGDTYEKIGQLFNKQAKVDGDLVEDNLEAINGVTKEILSLVNLSKCSVSTVEATIRKNPESKLSLDAIEGIDRNMRVVARTVDAELNWLQFQRESQIRATMKQYLQNQIGLYTEITSILNEALSTL